MRHTTQRLIFVLCLAGAVITATAQFGGRRRFDPAMGPVDRGQVPTWPVDEEFRGELFTFTRIRYPSTWERQSLSWYTDYPHADLNLPFRLQELTAMKVNPDPKLVKLTDPELFSHPWIFMSGVGNIILDDQEAEMLRRYLLNGGFLLVDDFWGQTEWDNFHRAIKKVFPNREPVDLPRSHPIFHCVYDIPENRPLQTCNIRAAIANRLTGITWEDGHAGGNTREMHFRAIFDDHNRMMVMICHNTDNGDGWEEEGTDPWFFSEFSEKRNYPLAINIIVYAMTH